MYRKPKECSRLAASSFFVCLSIFEIPVTAYLINCQEQYCVNG